MNLTGKFLLLPHGSHQQWHWRCMRQRQMAFVTDGNVAFAAVEDLGGGLKAGVSMDVRVRGRGAAGVVDGRDATVYLMGGFGSLVGGAVEAGNGIIGYGGAGAPVIGLDDGLALAGGTNVDWLAYTTPNMGGFTATVQMIDGRSRRKPALVACSLALSRKTQT
ncbi:MAG: porin [Rhodoferax sp.]|nr:porin [Rhodoferax sp.]